MDELLNILKSVKPNIDFEKEGDLLESGILDSLEIVEIIDALCEHYNIELSAEDIDPDNFQSVQTMYKMIEKYVSYVDQSRNSYI